MQSAEILNEFLFEIYVQTDDANGRKFLFSFFFLARRFEFLMSSDKKKEGEMRSQ